MTNSKTAASRVDILRSAVPVRKIHNLVQLVRELPAEDIRILASADLNLLNPWTIDGRYPTAHGAVTADEMERTVEAAEGILAAIRLLRCETRRGWHPWGPVEPTSNAAPPDVAA